MPEADRLEVLDADDLADRARAQQPLDELRVRRVAEHVGHGGDDARALHRLRDPHALLLGRRERLLDQQRVALRGERQRGLGVVAVERGDDRGVGDRAGALGVAPVGEAPLGRDAVRVADPVAVGGARLGHGDDARPVGMAPRPVRERRAARAAADDQERHHQNVASASSICSFPWRSASSGESSPPSALFTFS